MHWLFRWAGRSAATLARVSSQDNADSSASGRPGLDSSALVLWRNLRSVRRRNRDRAWRVESGKARLQLSCISAAALGLRIRLLRGSRSGGLPGSGLRRDDRAFNSAQPAESSRTVALFLQRAERRLRSPAYPAAVLQK